MKLLVIQEQHFTKLPNGEVWVDKQSDVNFWNRYLNVFDEIVVCARMKESAQVGNKALRSDRDRVSFVGMPEFRGIGGLVKHYFGIQKALQKALKETECVIFRAPSPISMVSYAIVRRSKKPFAVELMNNPYTHYSAQTTNKWYQPLISAFVGNQTKRMCKRANGVSYVTEYALQNLFPSTARLTGENDRYFESSYSTIDLHEEHYIKKTWDKETPKPIVFIHSGEMIDYRKGQNVFIETLSVLENRGYSVYGILIGDGEKRAEFEQYAKDLKIYHKLEFVGWKSGFTNVQKELLRGHIFIFPTRGEGLPRSLIEAMASGMLCFGSNIDGVPELLDESLLVNDFSGVAFADKIEPFLKNWNMAEKKQNELFEKSRKYNNVYLQERRMIFYAKLRKVSEKLVSAKHGGR